MGLDRKASAHDQNDANDPKANIEGRKSVRQRREMPKVPLRRSAKCVTVRGGQGQPEPRLPSHFAECGSRRTPMATQHSPNLYERLRRVVVIRNILDYVI